MATSRNKSGLGLVLMVRLAAGAAAALATLEITTSFGAGYAEPPEAWPLTESEKPNPNRVS